MNGFARNGLAPLVLRIGVGVIFLYHGLDKVGAEQRYGAAWQKPPALQTSPAPPPTTPPQPPPPQPAAPPLQFITAWVEVLGGLALLAGLLTRAAATATGLLTAYAIVFIYGKYGFNLQTGNVFQPGYEYKFALLMMCLAVVCLGGGRLAVDWFFRVPGHTPTTREIPSGLAARAPAEDMPFSKGSRPPLVLKG